MIGYQSYYILKRGLLNRGKPVPEPDLNKWCRWFEKANRVVRQDKVSRNVLVSTVFLGFDHSFGTGEPVLWETMIFGGPEDQYQERYTSLNAALKGHQRALEIAKKAQEKP